MNNRDNRKKVLALLSETGLYPEAQEAIAMTIVDFGENLCRSMLNACDEVFTEVDGTELILHSNHVKFGEVVEIHSVYFKDGFAFIDFEVFSELVDKLLNGRSCVGFSMLSANAEDRSDFKDSSSEFGW